MHLPIEILTRTNLSRVSASVERLILIASLLLLLVIILVAFTLRPAV